MPHYIIELAIILYIFLGIGVTCWVDQLTLNDDDDYDPHPLCDAATSIFIMMFWPLFLIVVILEYCRYLRR